MINEKLDIELLEVLKENGFTKSTGLEQICIPKIKSGRDLLCIAPNGSGKSTTIVVSVLQRLKSSLDDNPRAIIVVQNKERALEMKAEFERLGEYTDLRVQTACDDEKISDQKDKIYMGSDVVIGTAKRLNQVYTLYALNLGVVKIFAIDNAETVIKSINYTQIDRLSESMPKAQRVVFASHMNEWIERFADTFMNVQDIIEIDEDDINSSEE